MGAIELPMTYEIPNVLVTGWEQLREESDFQLTRLRIVKAVTSFEALCYGFHDEQEELDHLLLGLNDSGEDGGGCQLRVG